MLTAVTRPLETQPLPVDSMLTLIGGQPSGPGAYPSAEKRRLQFARFNAGFSLTVPGTSVKIPWKYRTLWPESRPNLGTPIVRARPSHGEGETFGRALAKGAADDAELVAQVKRGETQAYGDLVRRYQDRVFNTCWRICGHLEDARDLTQEAFLKAYEGLAAFRGESGFYTWVFRVAVNLALTHRRRGKNRRVFSLDQALDGGDSAADPISPPTPAASTAEPEQEAGAAERNAAVGRALVALDEEQRAVVVLRDMEGLNYEQIATILEIPAGTVKSRLFRARMALQAALEPIIGGTSTPVPGERHG
jgi:RNA polymerase sigma-70 factor (ECF subfamily)